MKPLSQVESAADDRTRSRAVPASRILWLAPGFCLWFSALVVVYVLHTMGCSFGWSSGSIRLSLTFALLVHISAIALLWRILAKRRPDPAYGRAGTFLHWIIIGTLIAALAKIVFTLGPVLFLTACI